MSDDMRNEVTELATSIARGLVGSIVDERRVERDNLVKEGNTAAAKAAIESTKSARGTNWGNLLMVVLTGSVGWFGWSFNKQLENIALKQDNAILTVRSDIDGKYVTQSKFSEDVGVLRQLNSVNSASIGKIYDTIYDIKTDVAVIKSEIKKPNYRTP